MAGINLGTKLKKLFIREKLSDDFYEDLEELLIEGDLGAITTIELINQLKQEVKTSKVVNESDFMQFVKNYLSNIILSYDYSPLLDKMNLILILGVNGVGKTTSIAKLANYFRTEYKIDSVLSAGDTFRAAAIDQLLYHGNKLNMRVVHQQHGSDPGAVIYDTIDSAVSRGENIIIADTAGRMHNRENLVKELKKIDKIIRSKTPAEGYKKILVIDATTGQNGLRQAESFHEAVGLDGIILAKYDSASKGGIVISISRDLGIPVLFLGTGEGYTDFSKFNKEHFLNNLLGL
ncbi:MAG: signal recognition particle-docking protein FtsY [Spirochaetales bacterium]|nr:signal recognition particle-docking protein FtsY [Spirochaetales bacterium]